MITMARKVRFGLRNTKYAIWDPAEGKYGEFKPIPWAVNFNITTEGGDGSDFYADDGICYSFPGTNGGYSADLEFSNLPDTVRADLLGEVADSTTGVQFEVVDAEPPQFALVFEDQTDNGPIGWCFYNCKASRPELSANTKNDSPDVDTETLPVRIASQEFTLNGETRSFVQGHIHKTSENATKYAAFFASVVTPTASA